jgi:two-component system chemotaxis sensor kinase CheA
VGELDIVRLTNEAEELLDGLGERLLAIESGGLSRELVNECLRTVHTLKGLAVSVGNIGVAEVAHRVEALLEAVTGETEIPGEGLDLIHEAAELLSRELTRARPTAVSREAIEDLCARLEGAAGRGRTPASAARAAHIDPEILEVLTRRERRHLLDVLEAGTPVVRLLLRWSPAALRAGVARLKDALTAHGELVTLIPGPDDEGDEIRLDAVVATSSATEALAAAAASAGAEVAGIEPLAARAPEPEPEPAQVRSSSRTVRVDIRKIDALMAAAAEVGLLGAQIAAAELALRRAGEAGAADRLAGELERLEARVADLRAGLISARMVSMAPMVARLGRLARRMAQASEKRIRFVISGTSTEVDKVIVEELAEPMLHLLRNAIDHGIEPAEVRLAAGKPAEGTITVAARTEGNQLVVELGDDGYGIDRQAIAEVAVRRGLYSKARVATATDLEILDVLFRPGFTTREQADLTSGRGVGLDAVRAALAVIGGVVGVSSAAGAGATFTIRVPITLAVVHALLVRAGEQIFAVPISGVAESVELSADAIEGEGLRRRIQYRGHTLGVVRVAELLEIEAPEPPLQTVVLSGVGSSRIGLLVDELLGGRDVVVKPLPSLLAGCAGIAGAADVGGCAAILVLDVPALLEEISRHGGHDV